MKLKELTHESTRTASADKNVAVLSPFLMKRKGSSDLDRLSHLADGKDVLIALEFLLE